SCGDRTQDPGKGRALRRRGRRADRNQRLDAGLPWPVRRAKGAGPQDKPKRRHSVSEQLENGTAAARVWNDQDIDWAIASRTDRRLYGASRPPIHGASLWTT